MSPPRACPSRVCVGGVALAAVASRRTCEKADWRSPHLEACTSVATWLTLSWTKDEVVGIRATTEAITRGVWTPESIDRGGPRRCPSTPSSLDSNNKKR
jgi:hypothetical protein